MHSLYLKLLLPALLLSPLPLLHSSPPSSPTPFVVTDSMRYETRFLIKDMERTHYSRPQLANLNPKKLIEQFLSELDPNHMFLTQPQIDSFHKRFADYMSVYLKQGDIFPAFEIFLSFKSSAQKRIDSILAQLDSPLNLENDSSYLVDRKKQPWPSSLAEADSLWLKRLQHEIISEILSDDPDDPDDPSILTPESQLESPDSSNPKKIKKSFSSPQEEFNDYYKTAIDNLKKRYSRFLQNLNEIEPSQVQELFLNSYTQLYDPHSLYFSSDSMEDFSMSLHNSLVGIGALLSMEGDFCTIKELIPGGPAQKSKELSPKDQILAVAQGDNDPFTDVVGMQLRKTIKLIRGQPDTFVRLLIKPADGSPSDRKVIKLLREEVKLTSNLAQAKLFHLKNHNSHNYKIGLIELNSFYTKDPSNPTQNSATEDVQNLLKKLKNLGAQAIILDFRKNGGGGLEEAINLAGLFIPIGPILQVRNTFGQIKEYLDSNPLLEWSGPLFIMTSKLSASSAEIVAGALKVHNRAILFGDSTTHGKGTVQALYDITRPQLLSLYNKDQLGSIKLTIQKWYLPDGNSIQLRGVPSDIVLPSIFEFLPVSEADLPNPLPWNSIYALPWDYSSYKDRYDNPSPSDISFLKSQLKLHKNTLPEFQTLSKNLDYLNKLQNQKQFSLSYQQRLLESQEDKKVKSEITQSFKDLSSHDYEFTPVKLDNTPPTQDPSDSTKKNTPNFDVYLREALRLASDYISLKKIQQTPSPHGS